MKCFCVGIMLLLVLLFQLISMFRRCWVDVVILKVAKLHKINFEVAPFLWIMLLRLCFCAIRFPFGLVIRFITKHAFEREAATMGVTVKAYRADNVPFGSREFLADLEVQNQLITFSGTGAHHQNGVAERAIGTITRWARSMLLHAVLHWPDQTEVNLWPFAMEYAVYLVESSCPRNSPCTHPLNYFPDPNSARMTISYGPMFGAVRFMSWILALQDGKKLPKWEPRARRGQFVGFSPSHSSTVGRILNPRTGHISPQYHCVYDDLFSTVPNADSGGLVDVDPFRADQWEKLVSAGTERIPVDPDDHLYSRIFIRIGFLLLNFWNANGLVLVVVIIVLLWVRIRLQREMGQSGSDDGPEPGPNGGPEPDPEVDLLEDPIHLRILMNHQTIPMRTQQLNKLYVVQQVPRPNRRFIGDQWQNYQSTLSTQQRIRSGVLNHQFLNALDWETNDLRSWSWTQMHSMLQRETDPDDNTLEEFHPTVLATKANSDDNPNWDQAMSGPDRAGT